MGLAGGGSQSRHRVGDIPASSRDGVASVEVTPPAGIALCAAGGPIRRRIEAAVAFSGYELVASSGSLDELIGTAQQTDPELLILVHTFVRFTPAAAVRALRAQLANTPLIVVVAGSLGATTRKLINAGIEGVVHEAQIEDALVPTIDAVLAQQLCVPASMRGTIAQPVFSHREKQVLGLLLAGLTNGGIAAELYLSESTVKSHLASSFRKLGVSSRAEAAGRLLASDSGLELRPLSLADGRPSPAEPDRE